MTAPATMMLVQRDPIVAKLESARAALAEATDLSDVKRIADVAAAAEIYAKRQQLGEEAENFAYRIKIEALTRLGELLREMPKARAGRPPEFGTDAEPIVDRGAPTLAELGITKKVSSVAQQLAELPEDLREQVATKEKSLQEVRMAVHYSSDTPEWNTPTHVITAVLEVLGRIDLDPCSNSATTPNVPARLHFTEADDGLAQQWTGAVYMNPPYGDVIGDWTAKLRREYEDGEVTEAIALVPARTDTRWFNELRDYPRCFVRGRLNFSDHANSAPFPSAAIYMGSRLQAFVTAFEALGDTYIRAEQEAA